MVQFESDEDFNDIINIMEEIQNELIKEGLSNTGFIKVSATWQISGVGGNFL